MRRAAGFPVQGGGRSWAIRSISRWANDVFGGGRRTVFAVRLDLDEKGGGVVDIFAAPIRDQGRGKKRPMVAVLQALKELADAHGRGMSYSAMQDSWHLYARRYLSQDIERGTSKMQTQREHLNPEDYGVALRLEAERGETELRDLHAEMRAATQRNGLAAQATKEAIETIAQGRTLDPAYSLVQDAQHTLDGDGEAERRLSARYGQAAQPPLGDAQRVKKRRDALDMLGKSRNTPRRQRRRRG